MRLPLCVVLFSFVTFSCSNDLQDLIDVNDPKTLKEMIEKNGDVLKAALGHGRTYQENLNTVSTLGQIESDHAPPFGILAYIFNTKKENLPDPLKYINNEEIIDMINKRNTIQSELKELGKLIPDDEKDSITGKPIFPEEYYENIKKMKDKINESIKKNPENKKVKVVDQLLEKNVRLRLKTLEKSDSTVQNQKKKKHQITEDQIDNEINRVTWSMNLENEKTLNLMKLESNLLTKYEDLENSMKIKEMGTLSIPAEVHSKFPSTGNSGYNDEIRSLKTETAEKAYEVMELYEENWKNLMTEGLADNTFKIGNGQENPRSLADFEKLYENNFKKILSGEPDTKTKNKKSIFLHDVRMAYSKQFMTKSIYYAKSGHMDKLMSLYVKEYKVNLGADFEYYKQGIMDLLKVNKQFGWFGDNKINEIIDTYKLNEGGKKYSGWDIMKTVIDKLNGKPTQINEISHESGVSSTCSSPASGGRRRRSVGSSCRCCIMVSKKKPSKTGDDETLETEKQRKSSLVDSDTDEEKQKKSTLIDFESLDEEHRKKILPTDIESIDSERLARYLDSLATDGNEDKSKLQLADDIIRMAGENQDKLSGTDEDIKKAKAQLAHNDLEFHATQDELARNPLKGNKAIKVGPRPPRFERVKVGMSKVSSWVVSKTEKWSGKYGKIMLGKSLVTGYRHAKQSGDYTMLGLTGGKLAFDSTVVEGMKKAGKHLAKKAATKTFGKVLGKLSGPVGAIADVGLNVYSIYKSVKVLQDPNSSKFDQNDAIADIVADSIDIAVTTAATIASLVFRGLRPSRAAQLPSTPVLQIN